jgi:hypothetical protein
MEAAPEIGAAPAPTVEGKDAGGPFAEDLGEECTV